MIFKKIDGDSFDTERENGVFHFFFFPTRNSEVGIKREIVAREMPVVRAPIEKSIPTSKQELCPGFLTSVMFRSNRNFRFSAAISGPERYTQLMRIPLSRSFFFFFRFSRCSARKEMPDATRFLFSDWDRKCTDCSIFSLLAKFVQVSNYDRTTY